MVHTSWGSFLEMLHGYKHSYVASMSSQSFPHSFGRNLQAWSRKKMYVWKASQKDKGSIEHSPNGFH